MKIPMTRVRWLMLVAILGLVVVFVQAALDVKPEAVAATPAAPTVKIDKSKKAQAERAKLIQDVISRGLVSKITTDGTYPRVYVMPDFTGLTFDNKKTFAKLVYAQYYDADGGAVLFFDALTNKELATFANVRAVSKINLVFAVNIP